MVGNEVKVIRTEQKNNVEHLDNSGQIDSLVWFVVKYYGILYGLIPYSTLPFGALLNNFCESNEQGLPHPL